MSDWSEWIEEEEKMEKKKQEVELGPQCGLCKDKHCKRGKSHIECIVNLEHLLTFVASSHFPLSSHRASLHQLPLQRLPHPCPAVGQQGVLLILQPRPSSQDRVLHPPAPGLGHVLRLDRLLLVLQRAPPGDLQLREDVDAPGGRERGEESVDGGHFERLVTRLLVRQCNNSLVWTHALYFSSSLILTIPALLFQLPLREIQPWPPALCLPAANQSPSTPYPLPKCKCLRGRRR